MFNTFKQTLTEVFIRIIEDYSTYSIDEAAFFVEEYFGIEELNRKPVFRYGSYRGGDLLYVSSTKEDKQLAIRKQVFDKKRLSILQRLIKEKNIDIRESFQLIEEATSLGRLDALLDNREDRDDAVEDILIIVRENVAKSQLYKEIMIRLLSTYPKLSAADAMEIILSAAKDGKTSYPLTNYPYPAMLAAKSGLEDNPAPHDIFDNDFLTAVDILKSLSYDIREAFYIIETTDFHKIAQLNFTRQQYDVLHTCLDSVMKFTAIHTDCREANNTLLPMADIPRDTASLDRAFESLEEELLSSKPVYTSFVEKTAEQFATLRVLNITDFHLRLLSPSAQAQLIINNEMVYHYDTEFANYYPFISTILMKRFLHLGITCESILAAEQAADFNSRYGYEELKDKEFLLAHMPDNDLLKIGESSAATSGSLTHLNSSSTALNIGVKAIEQAEGSQGSSAVLYASLLFLGVTVGAAGLRYGNKILNYCAGLNLFGDNSQRYRRVHVDGYELIPTSLSNRC
jgi:hypothetical protein